MLREANQNVRRERLPHANADQVNAISELVIKTFKGNVEVPPCLLDQLRPHEHALREMARRKHSIKRRQHVMMAQTGAGVLNALDRACRHCLTGSVTDRTRKIPGVPGGHGTPGGAIQRDVDGEFAVYACRVVGGQAARLTDSDFWLACEQQTHFWSSLLSLRKIASAIASCKTISVTSFFFFFTRPMKLSDRKMLLNTRGKSRGLTTASEAALCTREWGNAIKSYLG